MALSTPGQQYGQRGTFDTSGNFTADAPTAPVDSNTQEISDYNSRLSAMTGTSIPSNTPPPSISAPNVPTTLNSSNTNSATPITLPTPNPSTTPAAITGQSQAIIDQQNLNNKIAQDQADKQAKVTAQKSTVQSLIDKISGAQTDRLISEGDKNTPGTPAFLQETARKAGDALLIDQRAQENQIRALAGSGLTDVQRGAQAN